MFTEYVTLQIVTGLFFLHSLQINNLDSLLFWVPVCSDNTIFSSCFYYLLSSNTHLSDGAFWNMNTYLLITFHLGLVGVCRKTPHLRYAFPNPICATINKTATHCSLLLWSFSQRHHYCTRDSFLSQLCHCTNLLSSA